MVNSNIEQGNPPIDAIQLEISSLSGRPTPAVNQGIRKPTNLPATQLPLFTNGVIEMMATGAPAISATQAYLKPPDWNKYKEGSLYFLKEFGKGRFIEFYILKNQKQQPEFITLQAQNEILERYGVTAARLHLIFSVYAARQEEPWKEPFDIRGSDLLRTLGLNRINRMNKSTKLKAIAELAWIVGTLGAKIHWYEGKLNLCITRTSPIWTIVYIEEFYQQNLFQEPGDLIEVIIRVMPGAWTEKFLNKEGEQRKKALYQYGLISQEIFELDRYRQKLASALALYLCQNRRFHPEGSYRFQTLVESIMSTQEIEAICRVKQYRSRFIKQFYSALESLTEIGFKFVFGKSFPKALLPAWAELPDEQPNELDPVKTAPLDRSLPKGFFDMWLKGVVTVTAPEKIESAMKALKQKKDEGVKDKTRNSAKKSGQTKNKDKMQVNELESPIAEDAQIVTFTGDSLKQMRQSKGWTQARLASLIGKSVSWVKLVETGQRKINKDAQEKLQQTLLFFTELESISDELAFVEVNPTS